MDPRIARARNGRRRDLDAMLSDRFISRLVLAAVCGSALTAPAAAELTVQGFVALRGVEVRSQPSWRQGGFGRLVAGASRTWDESGLGLAKLHLAVDWRPAKSFGAYLHTAARAEPSRVGGEAVGIVEAYLYSEVDVGAASVLHLRLGHFLLPTSRENVEFAWSSPYTLTFSALNTWIGEEMRLTGTLFEALVPLSTAAADELRFGAAVFGGDDTAGALLAWRGWGMGDRLTTWHEVVPLPPLASLRDGGAFGVQLDAGTRPFGSDLDGRLGWAAYARWRRPERTVVQLTHLDNRGDRRLHDQREYAWTTVVDILGAELHRGSWSLAGEALRGSTGMGDRTRAHVQADLETAYLLASWHPRSLRLTLRRDWFEVVDRDHSPAENNDEDGDAWTLAAFWEPRDDLRLGVELLDLDARRPAALASGGDPDTGGRSVTLEVRYYFGN
jgi:hypothetical protein